MDQLKSSSIEISYLKIPHDRQASQAEMQRKSKKKCFNEFSSFFVVVNLAETFLISAFFSSL
jgi:hypothetical protein